ncbi:hypothetical protein OBBRIDRAFT_552113 [Obba rivulosa]|uniref:Uncharacterized protein n=1 Tax=Obba rivulosa TaxID=1052685 RepID=A0A8E2AZH4_9APHY|nr:hypothetical protein OBBRIDRAFT_552113 [Obba rivulosa]
MRWHAGRHARLTRLNNISSRDQASPSPMYFNPEAGGFCVSASKQVFRLFEDLHPRPSGCDAPSARRWRSSSRSRDMKYRICLGRALRLDAWCARGRTHRSSTVFPALLTSGSPLGACPGLASAPQSSTSRMSKATVPARRGMRRSSAEGRIPARSGFVILRTLCFSCLLKVRPQ